MDSGTRWLAINTSAATGRFSTNTHRHDTSTSNPPTNGPTAPAIPLSPDPRVPSATSLGELLAEPDPAEVVAAIKAGFASTLVLDPQREGAALGLPQGRLPSLVRVIESRTA